MQEDRRGGVGGGEEREKMLYTVWPGKSTTMELSLASGRRAETQKIGVRPRRHKSAKKRAKKKRKHQSKTNKLRSRDRTLCPDDAHYASWRALAQVYAGVYGGFDHTTTKKERGQKSTRKPKSSRRSNSPLPQIVRCSLLTKGKE